MSRYALLLLTLHLLVATKIRKCQHTTFHIQERNMSRAEDEDEDDNYDDILLWKIWFSLKLTKRMRNPLTWSWWMDNLSIRSGYHTVG